jgi:hypothetical protein
MKRILLVVCGVLATVNAHASSPERKQAEAAVGKPIESVAATWGTPAQVVQVGNTAHYVWVKASLVAASKEKTTGVIQNGVVIANTTPATQALVGCRITLVVGQDGKVTSFTLLRLPHPDPIQESIGGAFTCR